MAGSWSFTVEQGATFTQTLTYKDADGNPKPLVGLTARMQIRAKVADPDPPVLELTTENGRLVLTDPGRIDLRIDAADTALLTIKTGVYDLELVDATAAPEIVTRLLEGKVTISPEVTRGSP